MQLILLALAVAMLAACPDDDDDGPPCPPGSEMIGDAAGTPEIEIGQIAPDGTWEPLPDEGATLRLFTPPQGGKIALVGARIHDMSGCQATLAARLRDPTDPDEAVAVREGRTVLFVPIPGRDDWGEVESPEPLNRAPNVPACFNYFDRDMDDCPWILHVSVEDREGRLAEKRITVTPECMRDDPEAPDPALCQCECAARYDTRETACNDLDPWRNAEPRCGDTL